MLIVGDSKFVFSSVIFSDIYDSSDVIEFLESCAVGTSVAVITLSLG